MSDLVFKNVSFKFEREFIFKNINFSYDLKDFLIVLGPNGAGKSTFLKLILGILRPNSGEILREFGTQIKNIGYVPQLISPNKSFPISVLEVVLMGRLDKKKLFFYSKADKIAALEALARVKMAEFATRKISDLSGGQRQRVYIARALCSEAKLLVLDEPLANIDIGGQFQIYSLLKELGQSGIGIISVTHETNLALNYATKALYIENGALATHAIKANATSTEFLQHLLHQHKHICEVELALKECSCKH